MSQTIQFIERLDNLKDGDRSRLRRLVGQPLNHSLPGFDLFTALWWPLRANNARTPRRELSWLIVKLFCANSVPHIRPASGIGSSLPYVLRRCEPTNPPDSVHRERFRERFDAVICSTLSDIEPRLNWSLNVIGRAVDGHIARAKGVVGIDWALLLDDLSLWDRPFNRDDTWQRSRLNAHARLVHCHETHDTPQDLWACEYLHASNYSLQGAPRC